MAFGKFRVSNAFSLGTVSGPHRWIGITLFFSFLTIFLLLPSTHYMRVDGPLRCLGVFHTNHYYFHGNNHLLYPFWIYCWFKLWQFCGIHVNDPFAFLRLSQAMNSFLAAGSLILLHSAMRFIASARVAVLGVLLFGLSSTFLLHATNSAEVMPGVFFSVAALWAVIAGLYRSQLILFLLSGVCSALALASYEASGLVVFVIGFLSLIWPVLHQTAGFRSALLRIAVAGAGAVSAACFIYCLVYASEGVPVSQMPRQFVAMGGSPEVYGGFKLSSLMNLPMGFVADLYGTLPWPYGGVRSLLHQRLTPASILLIAVTLVLGLTMLALVVKRISGMYSGIALGWGLLGLSAAGIAAFPLFYWSSTYDKLWLLPLALLSLTAVAALRPQRKAFRSEKLLSAALLASIVLEAGVNLPVLISQHRTETPYLAQARDLARVVGPNDWVVIDFDQVSQLWLSFWGARSNSLVLPSSTYPAAAQWIQTAEQSCKAKGGRLLFVSVLDQDPQTWDNFLGAHVGIPYTYFDRFRNQSRVIQSYAVDDKHTTVRVFNGS